MNLQVDVQRATDDEELPGDTLLEAWANAAAKAQQGRDAQLSVRIVDLEEGIDLNESYRRGDGATNVLSFAFEEGERLEPPLLGDVVICAPVVRREALQQHKTVRAHFAHMVVHGVLHLLGYDHEREREAQEMEAIEREVMAQLGFDDPYLDRDAHDIAVEQACKR